MKTTKKNLRRVVNLLDKEYTFAILKKDSWLQFRLRCALWSAKEALEGIVEDKRKLNTFNVASKSTTKDIGLFQNSISVKKPVFEDISVRQKIALYLKK